MYSSWMPCRGVDIVVEVQGDFEEIGDHGVGMAFTFKPCILVRYTLIYFHLPLLTSRAFTRHFFYSDI